MKHLFNLRDVEELKARVRRLEPGITPKWGSFNPHRMLCHLSDQIEYALEIKGNSHFKKEGPPMFIRKLVRLYMPMPKGKIKTDPDMLVTQPGEWEQDKDRMLTLIDCFSNANDTEDWPVHPFFGPLKGLDWARLTWRHVDHHLRQFGV